MFRNTEKTLMPSSKLVAQLHQNCLLRALFNFFVKTMFFVKFHQSSFWDIFWKKLRFFGEVFLALIMFVASLTKMFSMSPEERLRKHFPKQWVLPFLNIERKEYRIFGGCFQQVSQTAVFLSRGTIWGTHFQREIYFQHFFNWVMEVRFFVSLFQETFQKFFFTSNVVFWGEICCLETSWEKFQEIRPKFFRNSHKYFL